MKHKIRTLYKELDITPVKYEEMRKFIKKHNMTFDQYCKGLIRDICDYAVGVEPLREERYGDVMTMSDFIESCKEGYFTDYNGIGNYCKDGFIFNNKDVYPSMVIDDTIDKSYTHVIWYNK